MPGLQQFLAFAQVARRSGFAAAARDLGESPSTLAKSVARLETSLGVKLFHRTTRQVSLTADGERLFHRCERLLAEFEDLKADAAGARVAPSGVLRVDLPVCYGRRFVLPLLAGLQREHAALSFEVRMQDGFADLVRDGVDIAVRMGELRDSTLVARRIDTQHLVMVASPWQLRQGRRTVEMHPACAIQLNDTEALGAAARLGLGLCQLPDNIVLDEVASGDLVEVLEAHRPAPMPIHAVVPSGRLVPPRVRVTLAALETLRTRSG